MLAILLSTAVLALTVAVAIMLRMLLLMRQARPDEARGLCEADVEAIGRCVVESLGATPDGKLDTLAKRIDQLQTDFDWVVGESVIQSAISVARTGEALPESSELSHAEYTQMLRRLRRH